MRPPTSSFLSQPLPHYQNLTSVLRLYSSGSTAVLSKKIQRLKNQGKASVV